MCLAALLVTGWTQQPIQYSTDVDNVVHDVENRTSEEIEDKLKNLFHESRNKLYLAFYNLSSYLPLDIDYAETVGKDCDVLEYNKDYYTTVGLVLGGVLGLLGIVFAFFGKFLIEIYSYLRSINNYFDFENDFHLIHFFLLSMHASGSNDMNWFSYCCIIMRLMQLLGGCSIINSQLAFLTIMVHRSKAFVQAPHTAKYFG